MRHLRRILFVGFGLLTMLTMVLLARRCADEGVRPMAPVEPWPQTAAHGQIALVAVSAQETDDRGLRRTGSSEWTLHVENTGDLPAYLAFPAWPMDQAELEGGVGRHYSLATSEDSRWSVLRMPGASVDVLFVAPHSEHEIGPIRVMLLDRGVAPRFCELSWREPQSWQTQTAEVTPTPPPDLRNPSSNIAVYSTVVCAEASISPD